MAVTKFLKKFALINNSFGKAKAFVSTARVGLERLALDCGLKRGHRDYTKFVILARGRSGTNLLRGLLNAHSRVLVFGEVFRTPDAIGWSMPGFTQSKKALALFRSEPVRFMETRLFGKYSIGVLAVGFKIFHWHARKDNWQAIWSYLQENKDIHIIHMRRENILSTHLSKKRAFLTNRWQDTSGGQAEQPRVYLDYEECLSAFEQTREWERQANEVFKASKKIDITYEELCRDREQVMRRVFDFLGVPYEAVEPVHHKQNRQSLSQSIENYQELKARFEGTPWIAFFKD